MDFKSNFLAFLTTKNHIVKIHIFGRLEFEQWCNIMLVLSYIATLFPFYSFSKAYSTRFAHYYIDPQTNTITHVSGRNTQLIFTPCAEALGWRRSLNHGWGEEVLQEWRYSGSGSSLGPLHVSWNIKIRLA